MLNGIRQRLDQLETATAGNDERCACGADSHVAYRVLDVEPAECRCGQCGEVRAFPSHGVKAYPAGLLEAL